MNVLGQHQGDAAKNTKSVRLGKAGFRRPQAEIERGTDGRLDIVKLFGDSSAFLMSYQNRRIPVGFDLKLDKFDIQRYQGTTKAKEYASQVTVVRNDQNISGLISMNEPMKYQGYTIYQASFQEDPNTREPIASVFSINQDPGRATKYIGSLILSLGIVWLFYQRRKKATAI